MYNWQKVLKRILASPTTPQNETSSISPETLEAARLHPESQQSRGIASKIGNICPACNEILRGSDLLYAHWRAKHFVSARQEQASRNRSTENLETHFLNDDALLYKSQARKQPRLWSKSSASKTQKRQPEGAEKQCNICYCIVEDLELLRQHRKKEHPHCPICRRQFESWEEMWKHKVGHHQCRQRGCWRTFETAQELWAHTENAHGGAYLGAYRSVPNRNS